MNPDSGFVTFCATLGEALHAALTRTWVADVVHIDPAVALDPQEKWMLRERALYGPEPGHWKVYVIDNAHWLSPEAWASMLKLVEAMPDRTAFFFVSDSFDRLPDDVRRRFWLYVDAGLDGV